ncbi:MAG: type I-C CRISPR-associated protein Cas7/Csd2 [Syntrophobacteraceae bacterium]
MNNAIQNRYDFVLLFDVKDGNPNGDPDAGNLPRIDPETGHGLVTDVCLKRKVRNYVSLAKGLAAPNDIYIKEKAVLGHAHFAAFKQLGIELGEEARQLISKEQAEQFEELGLPEGLSVLEDEDDKLYLVVAAVADKKEIKDWLKDADPSAEIKKIVNETLKQAKPRRPRGEEVLKGRDQMCKTFYDIRTFGAVLSLKTAPNCGQVRGPVQLTFARSIEPIVPLEHSITRMAVATEAEAEKQQGDNRTMGRKFTVPYALYRCHGFISAPMAEQTGFSEEDLKLFWEALVNMFEHDRSAARGQMATRKLVVFKHDSKMGKAHAHKLFDLVRVDRINGAAGPARTFADYSVNLDEAAKPNGVSIEAELDVR